MACTGHNAAVIGTPIRRVAIRTRLFHLLAEVAVLGICEQFALAVSARLLQRTEAFACLACLRAEQRARLRIRSVRMQLVMRMLAKQRAKFRLGLFDVHAAILWSTLSIGSRLASRMARYIGGLTLLPAIFTARSRVMRVPSAVTSIT